MKKQRICITGLGVLSPLGCSITDFWKANCEGKSGICPITAFDTEGLKTKYAGEIRDFKPENYMAPNLVRRADRFAQLGLASAKLALEDSKLDISKFDSHRIGVVIGTGLGGNLFHEEVLYKMIYSGGPKTILPSTVQKISPNSVASWIAITYGIKGPNFSVSTACSSGANAIALASLLLEANIVDICITGGTEAPLTKTTVCAYESMGILDLRETAPRPFDRTRQGMVIAEGAACLVLEKENTAIDRGATIHGYLLGYASNCGAHNMTAPDPTGDDAASAMTLALKNAKVSEEKIGYINAHGTGTIHNDKAETLAIKHVFGRRASKIPVSSTKSMMGHSIGGSGAIEAVVCVLALKHQFVPPTINYAEADPDCDLDIVPNKGRSAEIKYDMSNSFGFGSNNCVLVFGGKDNG